MLKVLNKFYPPPPEVIGLTLRNNTLCPGNDLIGNNFTEPEISLDPMFEIEEPSYPWWHKIFWISRVGWNGIIAMLLMIIPCE